MRTTSVTSGRTKLHHLDRDERRLQVPVRLFDAAHLSQRGLLDIPQRLLGPQLRNPQRSQIHPCSRSAQERLPGFKHEI